jgi:predicted membrane-bound dolichyl-phosphate-mannose-protein mannosyltransferase
LIVEFLSFPCYRDEEVYISCGTAYVLNSTPPVLCNFEHPPFAKYFIGLFSILGIARFIHVGLALASGVLLYLLVRGFSSDKGICGLTVFLFFLFDTIVFNTHRFLLLDPVALFFALLSIYLFQRGYYSASAVVAGLAVASKYSVALIVAGLWLLLLFKDKRFKDSLIYLALAFTTYFSTFIMDLRLGFPRGNCL